MQWSATSNIAWKVKLPGAGASSPVVLVKRIYLTCYSGYGMDTKEPGKQEDLRRHLLCLDRGNGNVIWSKVFDPILPEHKYAGEGAYQGYAASTPITDGEKLYVFFGKSGVFCFNLDGEQLWHVLLGKGINRWGSGASPMFYKDLLIVNASVEAGALIALDKRSGKEMWRAPKVGSAWGTPALVTTGEKKQELVLSMNGRVAGFDPDTGQELWSAAGHKGYVVPSVVVHDSIVYAIGGNGTSLAVKSGGRGDVTDTHVLWRNSKGPNASSPVYHDGTLYWTSESGGVLHAQNAATGQTTQQRLGPDVGRIWASPILADGKLYFVSQFKGTYVVAASPKFEVLAHNVFADDKSRSNASLAVSDGQLLLRNDQYLYCLGKQASADKGSAKPTALAQLAGKMKAGTWAELKTDNLTETLRAKGASGAIFGYNEDAVWHPKTRQFFYVGGDHNDTVRFVTYQDQTNAWRTLPQPPWVGKGTSHGYSHHGLDAERGLLYYFPFGNRARTVHRYDIAKGVWSTLPKLDPPEYLACCVGVEHFPELDGLVVANGGGGKGSVHLFREKSQAWTTLARDLPMGVYHNTAQYSPTHKVLLFGGGNGSSDLYKLDATGKVTTLNKTPIGIGVMQSILTLDPVSGDFLLFGKNGSFYVYDIGTDSWRQQDSAAVPIFSPTRVKDNKVWHVTATPVTTHGVTLFVKYFHADPPRAWVYLYKHSDSPKR